MRPVNANAIADLAAEQFVARHAKKLCLDIEQGIFDGAERLGHHAASGRTRRGIKLGVDALVLEGVLSDHACRQALDGRAHAG
jgi:hypothetical protein